MHSKLVFLNKIDPLMMMKPLCQEKKKWNQGRRKCLHVWCILTCWEESLEKGKDKGRRVEKSNKKNKELRNSVSEPASQPACQPACLKDREQKKEREKKRKLGLGKHCCAKGLGGCYGLACTYIIYIGVRKGLPRSWIEEIKFSMRL